MRIFLVFTLFYSSFLQAQSARELCQEWNAVKLKSHFLNRWDNNEMGAMWMQSQGVLTSELLVVSQKCQEVESDCRDSQALFMKGGYVCLPSGLEKAENFAYREKGKNFYTSVVPWGTAFKDKYERGVLTGIGGLKNPSHRIKDKVGPAYDYSFWKMWSPYHYSIKDYFHNYKCDSKDYPCIRRAHQEITKSFRVVYKDFPREYVERFENKLAAMNEAREAKWKYLDL